MTLAEIKQLTSQGVAPPEGALLPLEKTGSNDLRKYMKNLGWYTLKIHCDEMLKGFPDLFTTHALYGPILIETKSFREHHKLEPSQVIMFNELAEHGSKIYVCRSAEDYHKYIVDEHNQLRKPNWANYIH